MRTFFIPLYMAACLLTNSVLLPMEEQAQDEFPSFQEHLTSLEDLLSQHIKRTRSKPHGMHDTHETQELSALTQKKIAQLLLEVQKKLDKKNRKLGNYQQKISSFAQQYEELFGDDASNDFLSANNFSGVPPSSPNNTSAHFDRPVRPSHFDQRPARQDGSPLIPPAPQTSAADITSWDRFLKQVTRLEHPLVAALLSIIFYVVQNDKLIDRISSWSKPREQTKPPQTVNECQTSPATTCCSCGQPFNRPDTSSYSFTQQSLTCDQLGDSFSHHQCHDSPSSNNHPQPESSLSGPRQETPALSTNSSISPVIRNTLFSKHYLRKLINDSLWANVFQTILPHFVTSLRVQNGWKYMGTYIGVDVVGNIATAIPQKDHDHQARSVHRPTHWHYFLGTAFKAALAYCISCAV